MHANCFCNCRAQSFPVCVTGATACLFILGHSKHQYSPDNKDTVLPGPSMTVWVTSGSGLLVLKLKSHRKSFQRTWWYKCVHSLLSIDGLRWKRGLVTLPVTWIALPWVAEQPWLLCTDRFNEARLPASIELSIKLVVCLHVPTSAGFTLP